MRPRPPYLALVPAVGDSFKPPKRRRARAAVQTAAPGYAEMIGILSQAAETQLLAERLEIAVHQGDRLVVRALAQKVAIEAKSLCVRIGFAAGLKQGEAP